MPGNQTALSWRGSSRIEFNPNEFIHRCLEEDGYDQDLLNLFLNKGVRDRNANLVGWIEDVILHENSLSPCYIEIAMETNLRNTRRIYYPLTSIYEVGEIDIYVKDDADQIWIHFKYDPHYMEMQENCDNLISMKFRLGNRAEKSALSDAISLQTTFIE